MIMFLIRTLVFLVSAAIGLIVANLLLDGFTIDWADWWGFVLAVVIFAILQSVLAPWTAKFAKKNAPALLGGVGIVSTFIALLIVVLLPIGGLQITDLVGWLLGPVIVWLITALATMLLPMIFVKNKVEERRDGT